MAQKGLTLTAAESCTGGGIAHYLTAIPGSSRWFEGSVVAYSNQTKQRILGVSSRLIQRCGAVSEPVVLAMARGALALNEADFSIAVSGIAGPGGGVPGKPVGTVWIAWVGAYKGEESSQCFQFTGDREAVRDSAIEQALKGMLAIVSQREVATVEKGDIIEKSTVMNA
ncbi:hypothetical protein GCM10007877_17180 [Marinibactrum halimedae]|uniref:CinA C-terminal domain-containing protein n=2 Tax=Marinibactrum halimedae TaxID=1444977 RepID=A0AA37T3I5_9GAMM|nr:hypothetical protein GCM10007877_17180 [Marinibactrum halimedae]